MKSNPRRTSTSVIDFLQRHDGAAGLLPAAQRVLELRQDLLALLPVALRETCEVAGITDDGVVNLHVASASAAAKLRQTLPRLRDGLLERGWQVSSIRIRVQPRETLGQRVHGEPRRLVQMDPAGLAAFTALNDVLEESPLKSAVARLIRRRAD